MKIPGSSSFVDEGTLDEDGFSTELCPVPVADVTAMHGIAEDTNAMDLSKVH